MIIGLKEFIHFNISGLEVKMIITCRLFHFILYHICHVNWCSMVQNAPIVSYNKLWISHWAYNQTLIVADRELLQNHVIV